jgi:Tol biopolymer transport system component
MRPWWLLLVAGCSFQVGVGADAGSIGDGAIDVPRDAIAADAEPTVDAAASTCLDRWMTHTIRFSAPTPVASVNTAGFERDPFLLADERTMYLSSARAGSTDSDTWKATRATTTAAFDTPVLSTAFSTSGNETKVAITSSGLYAVLGSDQAGGAGAVDIWEASRTSTANNFGPLSRTHVLQVNTASSEHDPTISANGLRLYLAPSSPGAQHISVASRTAVTSNFSAAVPIAALDSGTGEGDPSLSEDERIIVFSSNRTGSGFTGGNVYYATRTTATGTFGTPRPVPDINSNLPEGDPHLSVDGCRLYFARDVGVTGWDIFVTTAQ